MNKIKLAHLQGDRIWITEEALNDYYTVAQYSLSYDGRVESVSEDNFGTEKEAKDYLKLAYDRYAYPVKNPFEQSAIHLQIYHQHDNILYGDTCISDSTITSKKYYELVYKKEVLNENLSLACIIEKIPQYLLDNVDANDFLIRANICPDKFRIEVIDKDNNVFELHSF